jgi:hypothetical protein
MSRTARFSRIQIALLVLLWAIVLVLICFEKQRFEDDGITIRYVGFPLDGERDIQRFEDMPVRLWKWLRLQFSVY